MQEKNLPEMSQRVISFFGTVINAVGEKVKFTQRRSKLTAELFVEALIMSGYVDAKMSLERITRFIRSKGIKISKQGLHKRFTPRATVLLENLFKECLQHFKMKQLGGIDLLKSFSSVKLLDSSGISLPESMKDIYPGFGGGASEAGLKLQVLFDYVENQLEEVTITSARKNDQSFRGHLNNVSKNALYLQDLGYFSIASFIQIQSAGAFFISRYLSQTRISDENNQPLDLIKKLEESSTFFCETVWLGGKKKGRIAVRLFAFPLSEENTQERLDKIHKAARKKGCLPSQNLLTLAKWSIYITNVPEDKLKKEDIHVVYTLRWQIELFFKLCKSEAGIDKTNSHKPDRVQCEIYSKLISVVILLSICQPVRWQEKQEISMRKAYKQIGDCAGAFAQALKSPYRLLKFLKEFLINLKDFALKDKRKKKRLTYQKLMDATSQEALV